jgi:hypothetical protein
MQTHSTPGKRTHDQRRNRKAQVRRARLGWLSDLRRGRLEIILWPHLCLCYIVLSWKVEGKEGVPLYSFGSQGEMAGKEPQREEYTWDRNLSRVE